MTTAAQLNYAERIVDYSETILYSLENVIEAMKERGCPTELSNHLFIINDIYSEIKKDYEESNMLVNEAYEIEEEELRRDSMTW